MTALSDRLNEAKGKDGLDTVVARAEAKGHKVHRGTFANYFKGKHAKRPSEDVLQALADGLNLKVTELRAIVGLPQGELGEYKPTPLANRLNGDQRRALDELIRTIVSTEAGTGDVAPAAQKNVNDPNGGGEVIEHDFRGPEVGEANAAQNETGPSVGQMKAEQQDRDAEDESK